MSPRSASQTFAAPRLQTYIRPPFGRDLWVSRARGSQTVHEYTVPKQRFTAEVVLPDGPPARMTFFHGQNALTHTGRERPSDVLNGLATFLPALDANGRFILLNVEALRMVSVSVDEEWTDALAEAGDTEDDVRDITATIARVEVTLDDGSRLTGMVRYELPESGRRLQDYLNVGDRFLALIDHETIRFIGRRWVTSIVALDAMGGAQ